MDRIIMQTLDGIPALVPNTSDWAPVPWVERQECPASFDPATGRLTIETGAPPPGPVPVYSDPAHTAPARHK